MHTIEEAYFLIRVGTWSQEDLREYIHSYVAQSDREISAAFRDGYREGQIDGRQGRGDGSEFGW